MLLETTCCVHRFNQLPSHPTLPHGPARGTARHGTTRERTTTDVHRIPRLELTSECTPLFSFRLEEKCLY